MNKVLVVKTQVPQEGVPQDEQSKDAAVKKGPIPDQKPTNVEELLSMDEARAGQGEIITDKKTGLPKEMGDEPRLVANYGPGEWVKMHHFHNNPDGSQIVVHWFRNLSTNQDVE